MRSLERRDRARRRVEPAASATPVRPAPAERDDDAIAPMLDVAQRAAESSSEGAADDWEAIDASPDVQDEPAASREADRESNRERETP
jgi:hypothetical protein